MPKKTPILPTYRPRKCLPKETLKNKGTENDEHLERTGVKDTLLLHPRVDRNGFIGFDITVIVTLTLVLDPIRMGNSPRVSIVGLAESRSRVSNRLLVYEFFV